MIIKLIVVGKTVKSYLKEGEEEYTNRLKHYVRFEEEVISELKNASSLNEEQIKQKEGEEILKRIQTKEVRKRMKRSKQKAQYNRDHKREPFYKRWLNDRKRGKRAKPSKE